MFMLFPTEQIWTRPGLLESVDEQTGFSIQSIVQDIKTKASADCNEYVPLHECASARVYDDNRENGRWYDIHTCNVTGGMNHCKAFEQLLFMNYGSGVDKACMNNTLLKDVASIDFNSKVFPIELREPHRRSENTVQESLSVRIVSGLYTVNNFAGIDGLYSRMRYVVVQNCYTCPLSPIHMALHDCTLSGCAHHDPYNGFATCTLTAVTLDLSEALRAQEEYAQVNESCSSRTHDRCELMELKKAVIRNDGMSGRGLDRIAIESDVVVREDLDHFMSKQTDNVEGRANLRNMTHNIIHKRSGRRTRTERRNKQHKKRELERLKDCSATALKMLRTGHVSTGAEYYSEALYRMQKVIGVSERTRHAMAKYLTYLTNSERSVRDGSSRANVDKKWYTIPEKEAALQKASGRDHEDSAQCKYRDKSVRRRKAAPQDGQRQGEELR